MVDLWSEQEFCLMQAPLADRKLAEEQLRNDNKSYTVDDKGYSWRQTQEDMEITFAGHPLTPAEAKAARIVIQRTRLKVELKGQAVFDDELWETVRSDESTWTVGDGLLVVQLVKVPLEPPERNIWPRCGKSEPHKYEKEYRAKQERKEARRQEREERLLQEALAEIAQRGPDEAEEAQGGVAEPEPEADGRQWEEVRGAGSELAKRLSQRLVRQGLRASGAEREEEDPREMASTLAAASHHATEAGGCVASAQTRPANTALEEVVTPAEIAVETEATPAEAAPALAEARPSRRRSNATTGTAAERERLKREMALKEERKWKQGTSQEAWLKDRSKAANYLGPLPAAEVWRREGRCAEGT